MYALAAAALGCCLWGFYRRVRVYRRGKPLDRRDHIPRRLWMALRDTLSQARVLRVLGPGLFHSVFFWAFLLLLLGTLLVFIQADFTDPLFEARFLKGDFYLGFSLVLDLAGLVALLGLLGLLVRRFVLRPTGLETIAADYVAHALLVSILLTGFLVEGVRMAATEIPTDPGLALFSPIGDLVGRAFTGLDPGRLASVHEALWWVHLVLGLGFIAVIPSTKLRHLVTTPAKYFFADLSPKGTLATIDLEDDSVEQFGAATVADLTWKDVFDADACTRCKRCQERCPAWVTEKPLSPMRLVLDIGEVAFGDSKVNLPDKIGEDAVWSCTTCRACEEICPARVEHVTKIVELRRDLTLMQGAFPGEEVRLAVENTEVNGNPFGASPASRADWAAGCVSPPSRNGSPPDILYFVGCYASFDHRSQDVAKSFVRICHAAGVDVGILGNTERCCGEPLRKLGNEYVYRMLAQENIEAIIASGATRIVTTCPHCFNTLARDYRQLGLDLPVEHAATFVDRLVRERRVALQPSSFDVTYHDSCYLGRYMDIFDEPRAALTASGGRMVEMRLTGKDSFCCGAGGGRILADERLGTRISSRRVEMAAATGATLLASSCPFCLAMLEDAIKTTGLEENLRVRDVTEIVAERLEAASPTDGIGDGHEDPCVRETGSGHGVPVRRG
jgi:Fe-S oxidoreductase/nitrate reductase gamma subunit